MVIRVVFTFMSRLSFIQSEVKPKPIVTRSQTFSRALRQLRTFALSFDWFIELSVSFVIGWSVTFGFGVYGENLSNSSKNNSNN